MPNYLTTITSERKNQKRAAFWLFFTAFLISTISILHFDVYAATVSAETQRAINTFTTVVLGLAVPVAAVGLASLGFSFFQGEKKAEQAVQRAKYCLIAVACMLLLTTAIRVGQTLTDGVKWDPSLPSANEIIPQADAEWNAGTAEVSPSDGG